MNKFETKGVNLQKDANSVDECKARFSYSCALCQMLPSCAHMRCERCAIKEAHEIEMIAYEARGFYPSMA